MHVPVVKQHRTVTRNWVGAKVHLHKKEPLQSPAAAANSGQLLDSIILSRTHETPLSISISGCYGPSAEDYLNSGKLCDSIILSNNTQLLSYLFVDHVTWSLTSDELH